FDVPSLLKPVRVERLQAGAPVRTVPWRGTPAADLECGRRVFDVPSAWRVERSADSLTFLVPAARLGTPRFPTGPPAA
ncbi:MAG TPA: hypothetical protein VJQ46_03775, partial [Gemmatimonadales bacterium]|nr:hypothetical protein [Gemmatimonadales bacterium]